jgi:hypothetical protein
MSAGATPTPGAATSGALLRDITIPSPRPFFMQLDGQGPAMSTSRVVWTAINGQGQAGTQADRLYIYDLEHGAYAASVISAYGTAGFMGTYSLSDARLAYVDTGLVAGGTLAWRVLVLDLHTGKSVTVTEAGPRDGSRVPPQIAFDGQRLLVLSTRDAGTNSHQSTATLYTVSTRTHQVLAQIADRLFGDPVLTAYAAAWTTIEYAPHLSSQLTIYDLTHHKLTYGAVGDVSQLAASGDLVVWKSGMSGVNGHIGVYALSSHRVLSANLAHSDHAIFPATNGHLVSWTYDDGSRVQIYSLGSQRVIYSTPVVNHRYYGLTSISDDAVAWSYTVLGDSKHPSKGYVAIHQVR